MRSMSTRYFGEVSFDLSAQDYLPKQLTAFFMYPEDHLGRAFCVQIYYRSHREHDTTNVPVNTFNKV